jgi:hypothetical protein
MANSLALRVRLPELPPHYESPSIQNAYSRILNLHTRLVAASQPEDTTKGDSKKLIYARILGSLILEGPTYISKESVAREVNSCHGDMDMLNLGEFYLLHFIRTCKLQTFASFAF